MKCQCSTVVCGVKNWLKSIHVCCSVAVYSQQVLFAHNYFILLLFNSINCSGTIFDLCSRFSMFYCPGTRRFINAYIIIISSSGVLMFGFRQLYLPTVSLISLQAAANILLIFSYISQTPLSLHSSVFHSPYDSFFFPILLLCSVHHHVN